MVGGVVSLDPGRFWRITRHALTRTLWLAQFSPAPWRLPAQRCLDEMLSYAASPSFDELLRQLACGDEQLGAPRGPIGARPVIGRGRRRRDHVCFTRQAPRAIERWH